MTRITFRQNGNHFMVAFTGHANAPRTGEYDLVCAAVSTLAETLLQATCEELERHNLAKINTIRRNPDDGAVSIDATATDEGFQHVLGSFSAIASGCSLVAEKYPDYVSLGRDFGAYSLQ